MKTLILFDENMLGNGRTVSVERDDKTFRVYRNVKMSTLKRISHLTYQPETYYSRITISYSNGLTLHISKKDNNS